LEAEVIEGTNEQQVSIVLKDEGYAIQGALFEVYREMGSGFLESVYQECLEIELGKRGVPFQSRRSLQIQYKGETLQQAYQADLVCFDKVIVELKAVRELAPEHMAQVLNYLKATGMRLGLLVNFGSHPRVTIKRLVL
jgi:GxxExxY protein